MKTLPDGTYDVIVVDTDATDAGDVRVELTITLGPHIGRMVVIRRRHVVARPESAESAESAAGSAADDALALLGMPGTLRVSGGALTFRPERI